MSQCAQMADVTYGLLRDGKIADAYASMEPFSGGGLVRRNQFTAALADKTALQVEVSDRMTYESSADTELWKLGSMFGALGMPVVSFDDNVRLGDMQSVPKIGHDVLQHLHRHKVPTGWRTLPGEDASVAPLSQQRISQAVGDMPNGFAVFSLHHPVVLRRRQLVVSGIDGSVELKTLLRLQTSGFMMLYFNANTKYSAGYQDHLQVSDAEVRLNKSAVQSLFPQFDETATSIVLSREKVFLSASAQDGTITSCRVAM